MTANLVGFVVGTEGVLYMANQIMASAEGNNISILLRGHSMLRTMYQVSVS